MTPLHPDLVRTLAIAAAIALSGSASAAPKTGADTAALEATLRTLIGNAECDSHAQCRTVAFGAKACGGPQSYLAWSTLHTEEAAVKVAAEKYAAKRRVEIKESGMASDCALVGDPGAYCAAAAPAASNAAPARTCQLRSVRPSGGLPAN